jgi:hypothetical protein
MTNKFRGHFRLLCIEILVIGVGRAFNQRCAVMGQDLLNGVYSSVMNSNMNGESQIPRVHLFFITMSTVRDLSKPLDEKTLQD